MIDRLLRVQDRAQADREYPHRSRDVTDYLRPAEQVTAYLSS
jgi:hypothetical protein